MTKTTDRLIGVETIFYVDYVNRLRAAGGLPPVILGPKAVALRQIAELEEKKKQLAERKNDALKKQIQRNLKNEKKNNDLNAK